MYQDNFVHVLQMLNTNISCTAERWWKAQIEHVYLVLNMQLKTF